MHCKYCGKKAEFSVSLPKPPYGPGGTQYACHEHHAALESELRGLGYLTDLNSPCQLERIWPDPGSAPPSPEKHTAYLEGLLRDAQAEICRLRHALLEAERELEHERERQIDTIPPGAS